MEANRCRRLLLVVCLTSVGLLRTSSAEKPAIHKCPDMVDEVNTAFFQVLNAIRENHGAGAVKGSATLTAMAVQHLNESDTCTTKHPAPYFNTTTGIVGLGASWLDEPMASNWRCVQAVSEWYYGSKHYDYDAPISSTAKVASSTAAYKELALMSILWSSTTEVGCALTDCPGTHVEMMCMFNDTSKELAKLKENSTSNSVISKHVLPPIGTCPKVYKTKEGDTVASIAESHNRTSVQLTCFGRQIGPWVNVSQGKFPITIPCKNMDLLDCHEYDFATGTLPTSYLFTPDDSLSRIGERFGLTRDDICCYNGLFNTSDYGFCTIPPLDTYNSVISIPTLAEMEARNCSGTHMAHSGKEFKCPDSEEFMYLMNQYRKALGLIDMEWDEEVATRAYDWLKTSYPHSCKDPYHNEYPKNAAAVFPSGPLATVTCSTAATLYWGQFLDASKNYLLFEHPFVEIDPSTLPLVNQLAINDTKRVGCAVESCTPYLSIILCMFNDENVTIPAKVRVNKPQACPTYAYVEEGSTLDELAAKHNLTTNQIICYGQTLRDAKEFRIRYAYGFPVLLPCENDMPKDVTCDLWRSYTGECGGSYTVEAGDSLQSIAVGYIKTSSHNLTAAELCCYNKGGEAMADESNCVIEPTTKLSIPCQADLERTGCENATFGVVPVTAVASSSDTSSTEDDDGTNVGLIVGVVIGAVAAVALVILLAVLIVRHRKKNQKHAEMVDKSLKNSVSAPVT